MPMLAPAARLKAGNNFFREGWLHNMFFGRHEGVLRSGADAAAFAPTKRL
jgi:hypothetical protein